MNRREFLKTAGITASGSVLPASLTAFAAGASSGRDYFWAPLKSTDPFKKFGYDYLRRVRTSKEVAGVTLERFLKNFVPPLGATTSGTPIEIPARQLSILSHADSDFLSVRLDRTHPEGKPSNPQVSYDVIRGFAREEKSESIRIAHDVLYPRP